MLTGYANPALWMAISAVIMIVASVYGNCAFKWLERISVPVLLLLMIGIMFFAFKNYNLGTVINKPGEGASWIRGFDAMIASALTFAIMAGDFARYGIHSSDKKSNQYLKLALCLLSGSVLGTIVFHMIGITAFTATGVAMNPVDVMVELGLGYWGIIAVLLATITTDIFFVRKQRYTVERMYVGEQAYPVVNMVGIGSWVFGTIVYVLVMNYVPSIGAAWVSLVLTAAAYILLSRWFPAHIKLEEPKELENSQVETA